MCLFDLLMIFCSFWVLNFYLWLICFRVNEARLDWALWDLYCLWFHWLGLTFFFLLLLIFRFIIFLPVPTLLLLLFSGDLSLREDFLFFKTLEIMEFLFFIKVSFHDLWLFMFFYVFLVISHISLVRFEAIRLLVPFILLFLGKLLLFDLYLPTILCLFLIVWELGAFLFLAPIYFLLPKLINKLIIIYNSRYRFLELAFEDPITEIILF